VGRIRDAIAVKRAYVKFDSKNAFSYFKMGNSFEKYGVKSRAIDCYKKALLLDPANAEAAKRLKKLQEANPSAPAR
jgi:tetratricopeptide (TPR) repeat protein